MEEKLQFQVKTSLDESNYIFDYIRKICHEDDKNRLFMIMYLIITRYVTQARRCKFFSRILLPLLALHELCFVRLALNYCFENCIRSIRVFCQCPRE